MSDKEVRRIEITEDEYKELLNYKYMYLNHHCPINYIPSVPDKPSPLTIDPHNPYPWSGGTFVYCDTKYRKC